MYLLTVTEEPRKLRSLFPFFRPGVVLAHICLVPSQQGSHHHHLKQQQHQWPLKPQQTHEGDGKWEDLDRFKVHRCHGHLLPLLLCLWFTSELAGFIAFFLREQKWCNH